MNNQMNEATRRAKGLLNLREVAMKLHVSAMSATVYRNFGRLPPNFKHKNRFGKIDRAHLGRGMADGDW